MRRVRFFFRKWRGQPAARVAPAVPFEQVAWSFAGGAIAIAALAWLSHAAGQPLLIAPFGASCVLLFAVPDSPLAQPRSLVGGHLVSSAAAVGVLALCGPVWWAPGLAMGLAIGLMLATRTVHPPAGAAAVLVFLAPADWHFVFMPVGAGALVLLVIALVFNNLAPRRRYPRTWG